MEMVALGLYPALPRIALLPVVQVGASLWMKKIIGVFCS